MRNPPPSSRVIPWKRALRYLAGKALTIAVTIFFGVFITVLLANQPSPRGLETAVSPFETSLESQIDLVLRINIANGTIPRLADGFPDQTQIDMLVAKLRNEAGLELPYLPRYLLWTIKALTFNWGELSVEDVSGFGLGGPIPVHRDIVLESLPNTLLLIGTAFLLIFLIGMPLSLYLSRHYGSWLDRILAVISPISSIPSWVIAVLLVALFAVKLRWLPVSGKFDFVAPQDPFEYTLVLARHMILPVSAIVLSLLFQVVYTWRTFFILYSEEDYVDLARAKGLPYRVVERQYILRPALPYVMTSFATVLIGFWQLTVALEVIFQWPGIGLLYIKDALPDFWGEAVNPGRLMLVIEIVVIFAYLLGAVVFFLDLAYVLVDPRIHLLPANGTARGKVKSVNKGHVWEARLNAWMRKKTTSRRRQVSGAERSAVLSFKAGIESFHNFHSRIRLFLFELRRYPSAIFGLAVIIIMLIGSIYALTALPFEQYGREFDASRSTGRNYRPSVAAPAWTNLFSTTPRLSTLIMNEASPQTGVVLHDLGDGWMEKTTTFTFDYFYREIPSDMYLYLNPDYEEKIPYVSLTWITPDGRKLELIPKSINADTHYDFDSGMRVSRLLRENPQWKVWFVPGGQHPTPSYHLLFAKTNSSQDLPLHGTYRLIVKSLLFEKGSDMQPELVLLGQVYGVAGTDYWRRDLIVPLFWGMPFALLIGLFGTLVTILAAMLLPAIGVWYGGWLDRVIQHITEINMVLPGLMIAVLAYALFNTNIWVILGIVVMINSFGSPIKTFRSALLQAREAPYIEVARSYGAGDFRIITRYLIPRILPVLIPQLVTQVPSFIFLEATLGFFNIKSNYPSWGRVIYDGLSHGALYGSLFWVLNPILLLLLTGLAFALLGSALERILNPRMLDQVPMAEKEAGQSGRWILVLAAGVIIILLFFSFIPIKDGRTATQLVFGIFNTSPLLSTKKSAAPVMVATLPAAVSLPSETFTLIAEVSPTPTQTAMSHTLTPTLTSTVETPMEINVSQRPDTYMLHAGEFPYCIARRFDLDPMELLTLNGLSSTQTFYAGMNLEIPQNGRPFAGVRMLKAHPTTYVVAAANETLYNIACVFGDVEPESIAKANQISTDTVLLAGQSLYIP
ncbi:MAG: ABC transporter permease subunit [Anaerolineales bacterium]|nr:ABC transporter permease subunit [Anaerolineales bacterium]